MTTPLLNAIIKISSSNRTLSHVIIDSHKTLCLFENNTLTVSNAIAAIALYNLLWLFDYHKHEAINSIINLGTAKLLWAILLPKLTSTCDLLSDSIVKNLISAVI